MNEQTCKSGPMARYCANLRPADLRAPNMKRIMRQDSRERAARNTRRNFDLMRFKKKR